VSAALDPAAAKAIDGFIVASAYGKLLGIRRSVFEEDRVRLRLPFDARLTTVADLVHGGAIASLVDVAATAAAWATPRASLEARGTTVGLSLSFLAPARGCDLEADARVVKRGGTLCVVEVGVEDDAETPIARALVTYKLSLPKATP
jgi:uncharacterized protein (TIGR00369 family)